jgi:hypothetical protein
MYAWCILCILQQKRRVALDKGSTTRDMIRIQEYVIFELSSWGDLMTRLIQRHVKYKESHGLDETIYNR